MKITNFTLILLLLMSSCDQEKNTNKGIKSRNKRDLEQQVEAQKTPEEALREKLNDNQRKGLDFLKEALGSESDFNNFLNAEESKIKDALDHIQSELAKCTGDNAAQQKTTFKEVVKGALGGGLDNFKDQSKSTCENN
ncbi:Mlp lipoprotein family protein (plasmid) [Borrelia crocidurae DOU]|uniref:Mlp lipoprotein family protein n=1 Tax=Borrelia crocidurae DOU TaxID=1293575 RepID=W5SRT8_9SPIR|nr:Mlp family lipoprotein [Borrelia crocidurae]AHH07776.1 Mlp lipoprotein family protein [Borrelia crocidurae DOU]